MEIHRPLRLRFRLAPSLPRLLGHQRVRESVAEHLSVLEAIERGDAVQARHLIVEHLSRGAEVRGRIFSDLADSSWSPGHCVNGGGEAP